ncbi:MAG: tRNA 2-thiouridine(34) synthase MnmA [Planctomycetaceae bacterium]
MKLFVAMSGGVDSSVAALLLRRAGHEVVGIHLRTGVKGGPEDPGSRPRCCGADEAEDARRTAAMLGIPFFVQNGEGAFAGLIDAFADAYARGETPNPCVACNSGIKFGTLLRRARALGADAVATGHYARRVRVEGRWAVARAEDSGKDQSYVLCGLGQEVLEQSRFPLGDLRKTEVRALAREAGIPVAEKPESQELCFVPKGNYREVVRALQPGAFLPGEIVDAEGRRLAGHAGIGGFTVGQRRGLGIPSPEPLYVLDIEGGTRRVTVGPRAALGVREARLGEMNWTGIAPPGGPLEVSAVLRYRARPVAACVQPLAGGGAKLRFHESAWPVTPGQVAVLYRGDWIAGSGRIRRGSSDPGPA